CSRYAGPSVATSSTDLRFDVW
nr:immunoglobulin heavy chain junction region [Macaca mulatta]